MLVAFFDLFDIFYMVRTTFLGFSVGFRDTALFWALELSDGFVLIGFVDGYGHF